MRILHNNISKVALDTNVEFADEMKSVRNEVLRVEERQRKYGEKRKNIVLSAKKLSISKRLRKIRKKQILRSVVVK